MSNIRVRAMIFALMILPYPNLKFKYWIPKLFFTVLVILKIYKVNMYALTWKCNKSR